MNVIIMRALLVVTALCATLGHASWSWAQTSSATSASLSPYPPTLGYGSGGPMMMLTASKDHTLFSPIYTDYEDIDGDGTVDYTFKPAYRYYGYFNRDMCYVYNGSRRIAGQAGRFEPAVVAVPLSEGSAVKVCPSSGNYWSGNFLNWATMTRIDVVRKILYGGFRKEDTATDTTLEMAQMSQDAHSFVKYYSGTDLRQFTPFDGSDGKGLTICSRGSRHGNPTDTDYPLMRVAKGNFSLWATTAGTVCNWGSSGDTFGAKVTEFYRKYGPQQGKPDATEHNSDWPDQEKNGATYSGLGPEFKVRVQACPSDYRLRDGERCSPASVQTVNGVNVQVYKPVGLLQEFGSTNDLAKASRAEFGLITGSYDANLQGGALRKNIGSINDEIDPGTGRFCHNIPPTETRPKACVVAGGNELRTAGIIKSFDHIRLLNPGHYNANPQSDYNADTSKDLGFVLPTEVQNGQFASWGNPMSEMLAQAFSYFAGKDLATDGLAEPIQADKPPGKGPLDESVGLPLVSKSARQDPLADTNDVASGSKRSTLYGKGICRPMHVLAISSGALSYDTADGGMYAKEKAGAFLYQNGQTRDVKQWTNLIGAQEGVVKGKDGNPIRFSVGSASEGFGVDCTAKDIGDGGLAAVTGICPDAPAVKGTYLASGAAFMANTHAIRDVSTGQSLVEGVSKAKLPAGAGRVKTYAASLAGGVTRIEIPIPKSKNRVYITPEGSWDHDLDGGGLMPAALLTFRNIYSNETSGAYVVTWNDAQFGGDYDMDLIGFIRWELKPVTGSDGNYDLTVLTDVIGHDAGAKGAHGFSIIGTEPAPSTDYRTDGRYLTHGSNGFSKVGVTGIRCGDPSLSKQDYALNCQFNDKGGMEPVPTGKTDKNGNAIEVSDGFAWPTVYPFTYPPNGSVKNVGFIDEVGNGTITATTTVATKFRVSKGADAVTLRDPLWYVAKYGSFDTGESLFAASTSAVPEARNGKNAVNWDRDDNSQVNCTGGQCADGEPDGYFLARRPELLEARLRKLFERIASYGNTAPAVSSAQIVSNTLKYATEFNPDTNSGNLTAYELDANSGEFSKTIAYDAGGELKVANSRQILTNVGKTGKAFNWDSIADDAGSTSPDTSGPAKAYLEALAPGSTAAAPGNAKVVERAKQLMDYMRGSDANEGVLFRAREVSNIMGPVVNSSPWVQDTQSAARFTDADFPTGTPSYAAYVKTKATKDSLVWVGSDDGMLHGFKAADLKPVMSFVPDAVVARLGSAMSVSNTSVVPLVDGTPYTADVLVPSSGSTTPSSSRSWRTYLFAPLGRGGRAMYALDVSGTLNETNAGNIFKWSFTADNDPDLGYTLVDPVRNRASGQPSPVAYLNNGKFAVLVPNGYQSTNGKAALFVLFVEGPGTTGWMEGSTYRKLDVPNEVLTKGANGLMGATWADLDNNGSADVVYATDLKGQVWKFDLRDPDPAKWGSALVEGAGTPAAKPVPLFKARVNAEKTLAITTAPVLSFPNFGGTMVSFGTGKAIESADFPDTSASQRFFTVWDKGRYVEDQIFPPLTVKDEKGNEVVRSNPLPDVLASRSVSSTSLTDSASTASVPTFVKRLLKRDEATGVVYLVTIDKDGNEVPVASADVASQFDPAIHDGWYFEFPAMGEAVVSSPVSRLNFMVFTSVRPVSSGEATTSCTNAPLGTLYAFNPINGLPVQGFLRTITLNGIVIPAVGVSINNNQKVVGATDGTTLPGPKECDASGQNCKTGASTSRCGAGKIASRFVTNSSDENGCSPASQLRVQWREIPGLKTK